MYGKTVSETFRNDVSKILPGLGDNSSYWNLFAYLAFGTKVDDYSGNLVISSDLLAKIEGKSTVNRNYVGRKLLDAFRRDVHDFSYSKWESRKGLARIITKLEWSKEISKIIELERNGRWKNKKQVYIHNGNNFEKSRQKEYWKMEKKEALQLSKNVTLKEEKVLLDYLNNHPPNTFYSLDKNIREARKNIKKVGANEVWHTNLLNDIEDQFQPFYKPTERSTRVFPASGNMLSLKSELRLILTIDWYEFDLKSAQLAICSKLWKINELKAFLKSGESIWTYLMKWLGVRNTKKNKGIVKDALYALIFGAYKKKLNKILFQLDNNAYDIFIKIPIIKLLLKARRRQFREIKKKGGGYNCFGQWISSIKYGHRSVVAQLAQAYELKILFPAIELAKEKEREFRIVLWQHDGFSVVFFDKRRIDNLIWNLQYVVDSKAKELGIPTRLECFPNKTSKGETKDSSMRELGNSYY